MMVNRSDLPVGITVLAIDDDQVALRRMYSLLKQCHYQAICMSQAITALELLENDKYKLDLIIMDIDMPGIDGHNLFEHLLNLNTGIPIIVSSMKRSKELVIQAITSGACEFLVKPVPIEELQNIWQHAFRQRNNLTSNGMNNPIWPREKNYETPKTFPKIENFDHIPKSNKKIKYQSGEKKHEKHQDLLSRKKCRVVWTQDLHRKFVAAVDKLGLDKAVPKKILELMNEENLTRENVASHLQKYRLFLKKSSEKANKVTSCGNTDSTYDQNFSGFNMQSMVGNKCISHLVPANIGYSNGQVYSDIEHNVAIEQVAEFPRMSSCLSSPTSDYYNPSMFRDLSGFQDDSLTSCVSISPYIESELHHQTKQFGYIDDYNMIQCTEYARNGVNSDFSNQLNHTPCSSPGLLFVESAISMIDETCGLVSDTNLGDGQLYYDELMKNLWLENTDPVDDGTEKGNL